MRRWLTAMQAKRALESAVLLTEAGNSDSFDHRPVFGQWTVDIATIVTDGLHRSTWGETR